MPPSVLPPAFAPDSESLDPAGPGGRAAPVGGDAGALEAGAIDEAGRFRLGRLRDSRLRPANLRAIRALCHNAYLGDSRSLCRVLGRSTLLVDTRDRALAPHLLMNGIWEMHITECLARLVKPEMTVVDAGANYGYFALLAAGLVGPGGRVLAVEANPAVADLLETSLELNGMRERSRVHRAALGDSSAGVLPFVVDPRRPMNAHLLRPKEERGALPEGHVLVEVPVTRLDDLVAPGERVDVMKVDIERAEEPFWAGARRVLTENAQIQVLLEVRAGRYRDPAAFFGRIREDGFVLRVVTKAGAIEDVSVDALLRSRAAHEMLYLSRQPRLPAALVEGRPG